MTESALAKSVLLIVVLLGVRFAIVLGNDGIAFGTLKLRVVPVESLMLAHCRNVDTFFADLAGLEQPTRFLGVYFLAVFNKLLQGFEIACRTNAFIAAKQFFRIVCVYVIIVASFIRKDTFAKGAILQQLVPAKFRMGQEVFEESITCRTLLTQENVESSFRSSHIGIGKFERFLAGCWLDGSANRGLLLGTSGKFRTNYKNLISIL